MLRVKQKPRAKTSMARSVSMLRMMHRCIFVCKSQFYVYNNVMGEGFRWNEWNRFHLARHSVHPAHAEYIVLSARRPYPSYEGDGRWLVRGQDPDGRYLQVVYVVDPDGRTLYVIHARPLTVAEKRNLRRRRR
jgi:uncharacterized DUF497 family protein